jgi:hypothetical protein
MKGLQGAGIAYVEQRGDEGRQGSPGASDTGDGEYGGFSSEGVEMSPWGEAAGIAADNSPAAMQHSQAHAALAQAHDRERTRRPSTAPSQPHPFNEGEAETGDEVQCLPNLLY